MPNVATEPVVDKAESIKCNPWDIVGLSDSLDIHDSQSLVLKESDIQDLLDEQEVEGLFYGLIIVNRLTPFFLI